MNSNTEFSIEELTNECIFFENNLSDSIRRLRQNSNESMFKHFPTRFINLNL